MVNIFGKKAVVLGGSISGILSARVLSDFFEEVIIIEKDQQSALKQVRRSVPQGRHLHVLLETGLQVMDELFPGFSNILIEKGSSIIDSQNDVSWYHFNVWKKRYKSKLRLALQSRPLLEHLLREKLLDQCKNVTMITDTRVIGLIHDETIDRITEVKIANNDNRDNQTIKCDFIVDAMGRGSTCDSWLKELGFKTPESKSIHIGMGYTSLLLKPNKPIVKDWKALFIHPYPPYNTKYGAIIPQEKDENGEERYMVALSGCLDDHAPKNLNGFLNFANSLDSHEISEFIRNAVPVSDFSYYRSNKNTRKYYEKLKHLPKGIVSIGDAILVPNPIYGQGMTVASLEAKTLYETLSKGLKDVEKRYYNKIEPLLDFAWDITSGENFRFPEVEGKRSIKIIAQNIYSKHLFILAGTEEKVWDGFVHVLLFLKHPMSIFRPYMIYKVFTSFFFSRNIKK